MATTSDSSLGQADVVAFLDSGAAFGGARPRHIGTHVAHVFLTSDRAWKLKRAVRFSYLDFTTADRRRAALEAELALNRRTAPALYVAVHPVTRDARGRLALDGSGEAVDWLLEMRRFADGALLSELTEHRDLDDGLFLRLADRLAAFHADADVVTQSSGSAAFRGIVDGILASLQDFAAILGQEPIAALQTGFHSALSDHAALLDERGRTGRVRHGHGDLHLANMALIEGELVPFDCLEFSEALATVDVLYDLAFPLMDLWHRGLRTQANILFNRYLDVSAVDDGGLPLVPLFMSARAAVRAHVQAAQGQESEAQSYLALALALLRSSAPRLIAIGGLSGSGKSTLARAIGGEIGRAPGARILRSDVLRKTIAGVAPETRLDTRWYAAKISHDVYDMLDQRSALALAAGQSVIVDAVFADARERRAVAGVAHAVGAAFAGLWLRAGTGVRQQRIAARGPDASDADVRVAEVQSNYEIGDLREWRVVETGCGVEQALRAIRGLLGRGAATSTDMPS